jgi:hypothetical protein
MTVYPTNTEHIQLYCSTVCSVDTRNKTQKHIYAIQQLQTFGPYLHVYDTV